MSKRDPHYLLMRQAELDGWSPAKHGDFNHDEFMGGSSVSSLEIPTPRMPKPGVLRLRSLAMPRRRYKRSSLIAA
jgi:hypothetical protein